MRVAICIISEISIDFHDYNINTVDSKNIIRFRTRQGDIYADDANSSQPYLKFLKRKKL